MEIGSTHPRVRRDRHPRYDSPDPTRLPSNQRFAVSIPLSRDGEATIAIYSERRGKRYDRTRDIVRRAPFRRSIIIRHSENGRAFAHRSPTELALKLITKLKIFLVIRIISKGFESFAKMRIFLNKRKHTQSTHHALLCALFPRDYFLFFYLCVHRFSRTPPYLRIKTILKARNVFRIQTGEYRFQKCN